VIFFKCNNKLILTEFNTF